MTLTNFQVTYDPRSRSNCWSLYKCCLFNLYLKNVKLGSVDALREEMFPIDFQVMWSKIKVKRDLYPSTHYFMILCLMVMKLAALVDYPYCFLGHKVKVKWLGFISALSTQYLWTIWLIISFKLPNLVHWLPLESG